MDASYKIQRGIHVHLIQFFMCPEFWVHIRSGLRFLFWISKGNHSAPVFDTTPPGVRAAADGLRWRASRESHPSEDLSELPPLLDPGITRGCGWTGVSLLDC